MPEKFTTVVANPPWPYSSPKALVGRGNEIENPINMETYINED
jgi:hypothetical protein